MFTSGQISGTFIAYVIHTNWPDQLCIPLFARGLKGCSAFRSRTKGARAFEMRVPQGRDGSDSHARRDRRRSVRSNFSPGKRGTTAKRPATRRIERRAAAIRAVYAPAPEGRRAGTLARSLLWSVPALRGVLDVWWRVRRTPLGCLCRVVDARRPYPGRGVPQEGCRGIQP